MRTPFEIIRHVIFWSVVFMIDEWQFVRVRYKCHRYKPMHKVFLAFSIFTQSDGQISVFIESLSDYVPFDVPCERLSVSVF